MPKVKCSFCDKDIDRIKSRIKKNNFCNAECMRKFFVKENHPNWAGGKIKRKCNICNKEFTICNAEILNGNGLFCSRKCYGIYKKQICLGHNNPNWKGGVSKNHHLQRTSSEYMNWRKSVFERDNYTCKHCKIRGGKLNAHHIIPFSADESLMYEISNGITLCEKCHRKLHKKLKNKKQYDIFDVKYNNELEKKE